MRLDIFSIASLKVVLGGAPGRPEIIIFELISFTGGLLFTGRRRKPAFQSYPPGWQKKTMFTKGTQKESECFPTGGIFIFFGLCWSISAYCDCPGPGSPV